MLLFGTKLKNNWNYYNPAVIPIEADQREAKQRPDSEAPLSFRLSEWSLAERTNRGISQGRGSLPGDSSATYFLLRRKYSGRNDSGVPVFFTQALHI